MNGFFFCSTLLQVKVTDASPANKIFMDCFAWRL